MCEDAGAHGEWHKRGRTIIMAFNVGQYTCNDLPALSNIRLGDFRVASCAKRTLSSICLCLNGVTLIRPLYGLNTAVLRYSAST